METIRGVILISIIVPLVLVKTQFTVLDCNGRSSICVGPLTYKNCVDNGNGFVATKNEPVQVCKEKTFCSHEGSKICVSLQESQMGKDDQNEQIVTENRIQSNHSETLATVADKITSYKAIREISDFSSVTTELPNNLDYFNTKTISKAESLKNVDHTSQVKNIENNEVQNETDIHDLKYPEIKEEQITLDNNSLSFILTTLPHSMNHNTHTQITDNQDSESTLSEMSTIQTTTEMLGLTKELTEMENFNYENQFTTLITHPTDHQSTFSDSTEKNIISTIIPSNLDFNTTSSENPKLLLTSISSVYPTTKNQIQQTYIGESENLIVSDGSTSIDNDFNLMTNFNLLKENTTENNQFENGVKIKHTNISNLSSNELGSGVSTDYNQNPSDLFYKESTPSYDVLKSSAIDFTTKQLNIDFSKFSGFSESQNFNDNQFKTNLVGSTPSSTQRNIESEFLYNSDIANNKKLLKNLEGNGPKIVIKETEKNTNVLNYSTIYSSVSPPYQFSENIVTQSFDPTKFENSNISTMIPTKSFSENITRNIADTNKFRKLNPLNTQDSLISEKSIHYTSNNALNTPQNNSTFMSIQNLNKQSDLNEQTMFPNNQTNLLEIQIFSDKNNFEKSVLTTEKYELPNKIVQELLIQTEISNSTNNKLNKVNAVNINTIPEANTFSTAKTITTIKEKLSERIGILPAHNSLITEASNNNTNLIMNRTLNQAKNTLLSIDFSSETSEQSSKSISSESSEKSSNEHSLEEKSKSKSKSNENISNKISSELKTSIENSNTYSSFSSKSNESISSESIDSSEKNEINRRKKSGFDRKLKNTENFSERSNLKMKKKKFRCQKEGKFPDPLNCKKYYICFKRNDNILKKYKFKCLDYHVFDRQLSKCIYSDDVECVIRRI